MKTIRRHAGACQHPVKKVSPKATALSLDPGLRQGDGLTFVEYYFKTMTKSLDMSRLTELYSTNEFTFAVAVILTAQATDKKVNEITPALFKAADTPEKMAKLGEAGLKKHIKVISFFNNKARNIIAMSRMLRGRALPRAKPELLRLPGIGEKTANVIMNVLWGAPLIGVDTHLFRLSHRFGWSAAKTPEKTEADLVRIIPKKYHGIANHVMVMHGRYICKALRPDCANCPVRAKCPFAKGE
ncbi:MAG: endonuclease III [Rickettsiales bacterium]|jgi:endonuclease-3|nr:endonuclease III [Rickettsiales bacterium]